jgi:hypothetical protein
MLLSQDQGGQQMRHPEYYAGRAEEARVLAEDVVNAVARKTLLQCASEYDDLAKLATVEQSERLAKVVKIKMRNGNFGGTANGRTIY